MNKIQIVVLLFAVTLFLNGCQKEEVTGPDITSLRLSLTKSRIVGDSIDFANVLVTNQSGINVMEYITIYFKGEKLSSDKIKSSIPSVSTVYAEYNNIKSNEAEIEVVEDVNLKFQKNVLIEQYTGTWCGWCPRAIYQISTLKKTDKKIVHVAYHLSDEMTYNLNSALFQSFDFTGVPTVHADRKIVWNGEVSVITTLHPPSRIGISMDVTGEVAMITADVNVKFGYSFTDELELSVYLMHDSLIADQANYYNTDPASPYYLAGATMPDFVHRNVMMKSGTNMFGDLIPSASVDIGSIFSKKIQFTNFTCNDIKKIVIIAFVTYRSGPDENQVLNSVETRVGEKLGFVYRGN